MIWVTQATVLPLYRLRLQFSDGKAGDVDLRQFILDDKRPIVSALKDASAFAACRVDMDTVVWENGFDLAPEFLYERLQDPAAA
jgi:hypothetical protein